MMPDTPDIAAIRDWRQQAGGFGSLGQALTHIDTLLAALDAANERLTEAEEALTTALERRCDNRKCDHCDYLHDEQPEADALRRAAAVLLSGWKEAHDD